MEASPHSNVPTFGSRESLPRKVEAVIAETGRTNSILMSMILE
jgi:hypothetical protein